MGLKLGEATSAGNVPLSKAMEIPNLWASRQNTNTAQCRGLRLVLSGGFGIFAELLSVRFGGAHEGRQLIMQYRKNIPRQDTLSHLSVSMEFDGRGMSCMDI